ncbi:MAG TPA: ferritin [Candidatus Brocadiia bacterium]|nr:ferritin [Candidatus Brocadiia bacterium]
MIGKKMEAAINEQINAELYSAYLYASMASYFASKGLKGFANWMKIQCGEEVAHAMRFYGHVLDRGGRVLMKAIKGPETEWASPLAVFEAVAVHEAKVTALINGLVKLARKEEDEAALAALQWFVTEQIEEEANAADIVQKLKLMGDSPQGLFMMDAELGARTPTPGNPAPTVPLPAN